jgi:DNA-binding CsgD family transcriptional regulator/tetratricopeptide (TPR) repeat protein
VVVRAELEEQFGAALDRLGEGLGGLILLDGESGIGKTSLLRRVMQAARQADFHVLYGRGEEMETTRPFRPIIEALQSDPITHALAAHIASGALVPSDRVVTEAAFVAADHLVGRLEVIANARPVLLALDDMQWADSVSLQTVARVVERLIGSAILVIVAARESGQIAVLDDRADAAFHLTRLDRDEVAAWVSDLAPGQPDADLIAALERCDGLPLHLARTLRHAELVVGEAGPMLTAADAPRLEVQTRDVLRVASLLGQRFALGELGDLLGRTVTDVLLALTPALESGLIDDDGDAFRFAHPSDRAAFELQVPLGARQALHLQIASTLRDHGGESGRILAHLLASGPLPLDVCLWAVEVARQQSAVAPEATAGLFRAALAKVTDPLVRDQLNADLAEALYRAGQREAAAAHATHALTSCTHYESGLRLRSVRYSELDHAGNAEARLALVDAELALSSGPLRRWLLARRASALLFLGRVRESHIVATEACALTEGQDDGVVELLGRMTLGWAAAAQGRIDEAITACERAAFIERALGRRIDQVEMFLGTVLSEADRFDEAAAVIRNGRDRDLGRGDVEGLSHYQWVLAGMAYFGGDLDSAEIEAKTGIDMARQNLNGIGQLLGHAFVSLVALNRGDLAAARAALDAGQEQIRLGGPGPGIDFHFWVSALIAEAEGDPATALTLLKIWWDFMEETRYFLSWRAICPDLVRIAVSRGERDLAHAVTEAAIEGARLAGPSVLSAQGAALRCQAWLHHDRTLAEAAATLLAPSPRHRDQQLALADAAALSTSRTSARARRPVPIARRRPDELTPAELRIVREVAKGHSNREIAEHLLLSRYTVENHLKSIFLKLGVKSRSALGVRAVESGWTQAAS